MSVVSGKRGESKLEVINASKDLVRYTYDRVKDNNIISKTERWIMGYPTWKCARNARSKIIRANAIRVKTKAEAERRCLLEKEAIGHLEDLTDCIDILQITNKISGDRADYWIGLIDKTIIPLKGWLKSDEQRYKQFG